MNPVLALCLGLLAGPIGATAVAAAPVAIGAVVPDFTLRDQFDRSFRLADHADSVVVLICGDRQGSRGRAV